VTEFFERLGPAQQQRIIFREGATRASRMLSIVMCVVLLALLLGVLLFGVVSGGFFEEEYAWLGIPLVLLFVAMLSGILWRTLKSEQKTFDPQAIPQHCLPPAPR
jgi:MFS family permease